MVTKINISIKEELVQELDRAAKESHATRSGFLSAALKHYLEELAGEKQKEKRLQASRNIDRFREEFGGWDGAAEVLKWRLKH